MVSNDIVEQTFSAVASEYASEHISRYGFPENPAVHRAEIEMAFMQGAQWCNDRQINRLKTELTKAEAELESVMHKESRQ